MGRVLTSAIALLTLLAALSAQTPPPAQGGGGQRGRGGVQRPSRDAARPVVEGTGSIAGRVLAADTSRPLERARVIATGGGRPFAATTDEQGRFRITGLQSSLRILMRRPRSCFTSQSALHWRYGRDFPDVDQLAAKRGTFT